MHHGTLQQTIDERHTMTRIPANALCLLLVISCTTQDDHLFTRLSERHTGISFVNENHETERSNILTYEYFYNGGGVALGDINNDGLVDIYLTSNLFSNKLYLNEGDFKFRDITEQSGTACEVGWKTGVTMVDVNGDGLLDIYVCRSANPVDKERRRNILLINNGDLTFTDKAKEYNLDDPSYSTQAAFFDFDRDGDLDMVLLNHSLLEISNVYNLSVKNSNERYPDVGNKLYRNDNGYFTDVSDSLGVYGSAFNYGLGISLSDVNNDGWIDMYLGCDYTARDRMLINDQGRFFVDVTDQLSHISKFTMGTDIVDINGDQHMDIFTLDMLPKDNYRQKQLMGVDEYNVFNTMVRSGLHAQYMRNMLHLNNGNGTFSEIGQLAGVSNTDWSWSVLIEDFDIDGVPDIFVTNGFKRDLTNNDFAKFEAAKSVEAKVRQGEKVSLLEVIAKFEENRLPNYAFRGNDNLTFTDVTKPWGFDEPTIANGAAYADLDNDGDLDLVVNNMNDKAGIYRNNSERLQHNFLAVKLTGKTNKFAVGARVTVFAGGKTWVRENLPVRGFQSSVDPVLHFGLGAVDRIDSIVVRWPTGGYQTVTNAAVNQRVDISETESKPRLPMDALPTWFRQVDVVPDFSHAENEYVDFNIQSLLPRLYSTMGPALAVADVNGDGLSDILVGGAKGQATALFLGSPQGFVKSNQSAFEGDKNSEDIDAIFFDADGDGDKDLYVVSGGYEYFKADQDLQDRLYVNDGKGQFSKSTLPEMRISGSCVRPADVDGDGDMDLFVGGRIVPGRYPETPESVLLINDGRGEFTVSSLPDDLKHIGMVTDAVWVDLNGDQYEDLVVVGEWMGIEVFLNESGTLRRATSDYVKESTSGWWNCIVAADFDDDGDIDFVVGNVGLNNQIKATAERPAMLWYADFDDNGSVDPIIEYYIMGRSYPYPTRDELVGQLPGFRKRFKDYDTYSRATLDQLLTPQEKEAASRLAMEQMQSCFVRNESGRFVVEPLPIEAQIAPVFAVAVLDANGDGKLDFVAGGNLTGTRSRTGKMTGNTGFLFLGDGKGGFEFVKPEETGLQWVGDVRKIVVDGEVIVAGINNAPIRMARSNAERPPVAQVTNR